jgi:hypothetical protein
MCKYVYILSILLIFSCAEAPVAEKDSATQEAQAALTYTSLDSFHIDGKIHLPDVSKRGVTPTMIFNDITGMLDVKVGRGFHIQMREQPQDLESLKSEWSFDPVWTHEVIQEDSEHILYSKQLPDGSMQQFHFLALIQDADRAMLIRSASMEEFDKEQAVMMLESARTFTWNSALAITN